MCRRRSGLAAAMALVCLGVVVLVGVGASPAAARVPALRPVLAGGGASGPCDVPLVGAVCAVPEVVGDAVDAVTGIPGAIAGDVTEAFARWIASGAAGFLEQAGRAIFSGTEVDLLDEGENGRPWFLEHYDKMALVGLSVFAPMLMLAVLHAVFSQSFGLLGRALANLPIAAIGTAAAVAIVGLLLGATDQASSFLAGGLGADSENFLAGIVATLVNPVAVTAGGGAAGLFGVALLALFMAFAAFVVWLELLVREAAIYLTVLFLPIGFATYIWPALSAWLRRLVEVIVALVLSKLLIVAALSLAGSALAAQEGLAALVAGAGMLALAAFAPFALFKLIPIASMAAISSLEGQGRRGARAAVPRASTMFYARQLSGGGHRSPSSTTGGSGWGPRPGENPPPPPPGGGGPSGGGGRAVAGAAARKGPVGSAGRAGLGGGFGGTAGAVGGPAGAAAAVAGSAVRTAKNTAASRVHKGIGPTPPAGDGGESR